MLIYLKIFTILWTRINNYWIEDDGIKKMMEIIISNLMKQTSPSRRKRKSDDPMQTNGGDVYNVIRRSCGRGLIKQN